MQPSKNDLSEIRNLMESKPVEVVDEMIEEVTDETTEEVVEEVAEEVTEEVTESTDEEITAEETEEPADEQPAPYTMKSLAEAIEMPISDMYSVLIPMEGGEDVPVGELKNKYQNILRERDGLQELVSTHKQQQETGATPVQLNQQEMESALNLAAIQKEFNDTDWKELEEIDPGQAALERQKLESRYAVANQELQGLSAQRQTANSELLAGAHKKMMEIIPQWNDDKVKTDDLNLMKTAMLDVGYDQNAVNNIADPYAMKLLQELITLRKEKAEGMKTLKKVSLSPKVLKKSGKPATRKGEDTRNLVSKARKTRDKGDQLDAVKSILRNA